MKKPNVNSVLAVVLMEEKILLTKRRDIPVWVLPGGKIDKNESPEKAIVREVLEETGTLCSIEQKVCLFTSSSIFIKPVYLYLLKAKPTPLTNFDPKEVKNIGLFTIDTLPNPLAPLYKIWIEKALLKKPYHKEHIAKFSLKDMLSYFLSNPLISIRFLLMRVGIHINT